MKRIPVTHKGKTLEALVDDADYARLSLYKWRIRKGYAIRNLTYWNGKKWTRTTITMHKDILSHRLVEGMVIDHKNRNRLDNRASVNLRHITQAQNSQNRSGWTKGRKAGKVSQFRGVRWHEPTQTWNAHAYLNGRHHCLGYFKCEMKAHLTVSIWRAQRMPHSHDDQVVYEGWLASRKAIKQRTTTGNGPSLHFQTAGLVYPPSRPGMGVKSLGSKG
jgi:hypothetical protein